MPEAALVHDDSSSLQDDVVCLRGLAWADYERLLEIRGEDPRPRYTFLEGQLEIMSPSKSHESIKSTLGSLVEVWCLERGIEFTSLGSWTLKNEPAQRGLEPDECFVFGDAPVGEAPHLAIEVEWTRGGVDRLRVYERLGVGEVWVWARGRLQVHVLESGHCVEVDASRVLPGIDLRLIERLLEAPTTSRAIREFREAIRAG